MNKTMLALATALVIAGSAAPVFAEEHHPVEKVKEVGREVKNDVKKVVDRITTDDNDDGSRWDRTRFHMTRPHVYTTVHPYTGPVYVAPVGYHYTRYNVGTSLPAGYYGDTYYIDYKTYYLPPPPDGYRWTRVGNDVYLVRTTSGMIRDAVYDLFH